jgi:hypothetical protein
MAAPAIPWDKILRYGPLVVDTAGKALDRVMKWRAANPKPEARVEAAQPREQPLTVEQLSDAVAEQARLAKQLAEQVSSMSTALTDLSAKVAAIEAAHAAHAEFETRTSDRLDRLASEVSFLKRRSNIAIGIAAVSIVAICGLLFVTLWTG